MYRILANRAHSGCAPFHEGWGLLRILGSHEGKLTDARAGVHLVFLVKSVLDVDLEDVARVKELVDRFLLLARVWSDEGLIDD
jgi:hypothetical protein